MGLSHTVSEINRDFSRKPQIFPTPVYLTPPLKRFPLELGTVPAHGVKKKLEWTRTIGLRKKSDVIFSHLEAIHECDRQTDGHWLTAMTVLTHIVAQ